jgi:drug/metabolite transporter (DMT)-like permease
MTLLWSANFVIAKFALREIPPLLVAGLRMVVAAACMIPIYRQSPHTIDRRDLPRMLLLGTLGVGLNQVFFVMGMARTSVAHAAIIIGLTPVTVLLFAVMAGQERLRLARLGGMLLALSGVGVLQLSADPSRASTFTGDVLIFIGSSVFALYTVAGKGMAHKLGSITVNTVAYLASAVVLLPMTAWLSLDFNYRAVSWVGWTSLLYMAVFSSVLCYLIYYYALSHASASRVAAFSYVQPIVATLMAIPLLGERVTRPLIIGGGLVFLGVLLAASRGGFGLRRAAAGPTG